MDECKTILNYSAILGVSKHKDVWYDRLTDSGRFHGGKCGKKNTK